MLYNLYPLSSVVVFMNEAKSPVKTLLNNDRCLDQSNSRTEHQLIVSSFNYDFRGTTDLNCMSFAAIYIQQLQHRAQDQCEHFHMNGSLPSDILSND